MTGRISPAEGGRGMPADVPGRSLLLDEGRLARAASTCLISICMYTRYIHMHLTNRTCTSVRCDKRSKQHA